ncbi:hypothetical protein CRYUN_Cryun03dG0078700 [Craigia yunnanensis]
MFINNCKLVLEFATVAGVHLSYKTVGILSTIFDIGGVFGGVMAGFISDIIEARAVTSVTFIWLSSPSLILYRVYGSVSMVTNITLMFLSGLLVNGPCSLITTAVAADLPLGPLLAGYISTRGWNRVFLMLIVAIFFASLFLIRVAKTEIERMVNEGKGLWSSDCKLMQFLKASTI